VPFKAPLIPVSRTSTGTKSAGHTKGNFVLVVTEATFGDVPTGIYDLYRIEDGKIAEHWDTLETIPPRADWKNQNGKF
jgi:predicted SnoaL-like aldol condensation-catalyzing enzyme